LAARHNAGGDSVHNQTCDKLTRGSRQAAAGPQSAVRQKPSAWFTPRLLLAGDAARGGGWRL